jgi:uncharacterized repeat protein (TIGR01451 family)
MKYLTPPLMLRQILILIICAAANFVSLPAIASLQTTTSIVSRTPKESQLDLILQVEKFQNQAWKPLPSKISFQSGDRLRYRVKGHNQSVFSLAQVVITQPISKDTHYVLDSATGLHSAVVTFSIDEGKTYSATPMITVKQDNEKMDNQKAPVSLYTNIRWEFPGELPSQSPIDLSYQVQVR